VIRWIVSFITLTCTARKAIV